ncbi:glycosyltransferase, partial [Neisseria meningitidis]|uniref:glycosyltransferase n=1 Tax=Neisseria meningitidis TaxID=487 RepID=UPI0021C71E11
MKIILTTSMSGLGGTETATVRLGRLLKRRGHDIILASSDGPFVGEAQASGIRWQPVDFYRGGLAGYLKSTFAYARMLRREQPDIIDCQMARVVPACALAAKIVSPKTKIIYHSHGLDAATYPKIAKLFDKLGVYIIGNCKHEREKLIRHGFPAGRIAYAYNALPPAPPLLLPSHYPHTSPPPFHPSHAFSLPHVFLAVPAVFRFVTTGLLLVSLFALPALSSAASHSLVHATLYPILPFY